MPLYIPGSTCISIPKVNQQNTKTIRHPFTHRLQAKMICAETEISSNEKVSVATPYTLKTGNQPHKSPMGRELAGDRLRAGVGGSWARESLLSGRV